MRLETKAELLKIAGHLKKGSIVIFPTDTLYGIGCLISNKNAIRRLYKIRKNPVSKPTLILASDNSQAYKYGYFNKDAKRVVTQFWPGPLTAVVKAKKTVPNIIRSKENTVAIRVPKQSPLQKIIKMVDEPILAPSANFYSKKAPITFKEIDKKLLALVDYKIDINKLSGYQKMSEMQSTIVDLRKGSYKILRDGAISKIKLDRLLRGELQ